MKSLEIIKDLIWKTQKQFDYVDFNQDHNQLEKELGKINSEFRKLQQIKQDLEVLEIFKKFFGDVEIKTYEWDGKSNARMEFSGSGYCNYPQSEEEASQMKKLKQWLEENK